MGVSATRVLIWAAIAATCASLVAVRSMSAMRRTRSRFGRLSSVCCITCTCRLVSTSTVTPWSRSFSMVSVSM